MKKIAAVAAVLAGISSAAVAQTASDPLLTRRGWEIGLQASHYHYEESGLIKLIGNRGGILGAYTFTDARHVFSKIDVRESYSRLKYQSNGTGTKNDIPDFIVEVRAVAGMDILLGSSVSLSPYLGLGYRYLYNDLRGYSSSGAVGYRRESNYVYAPLGLTTRVRLGEGWVLAPTVEADIFIQGRQKTYLSDANSGVHDVINSQDRGRGYRGYLMFEKDQWVFGAWMHWWRIRDSDIQPIGGGFRGLEPENWTREAGLELKYRF